MVQNHWEVFKEGYIFKKENKNKTEATSYIVSDPRTVQWNLQTWSHPTISLFPLSDTWNQKLSQS